MRIGKIGFKSVILFVVMLFFLLEAEESFCFAYRYNYSYFVSPESIAPYVSRASRIYGIHPLVIESIIEVESKYNVYALGKNVDGSYDVGLMQINSRWIPILKKMGIRPEDLWRPDVNIMVGSWILARCIGKHGYTWEAIGCYNSKNPYRKKKYAFKVYTVFLKKIKKKYYASL